MSLRPGLMPYRIRFAKGFERDFKTLEKDYKSKRDRASFREQIKGIGRSLSDNPRPTQSRAEPLPPKSDCQGLEFRKLPFRVHKRQGASGQGRLMYLVADQEEYVKLTNLYTHKQYPKRPPDGDIRDRLEEES